jgi:hypothetical protein
MIRADISRPPLPAPPLPGGCHCGAVRYAVTARPLAVNACHCGDCKRLAGGPFGLYLHVPRGSLDVSGGVFAATRPGDPTRVRFPPGGCRRPPPVRVSNLLYSLHWVCGTRLALCRSDDDASLRVCWNDRDGDPSHAAPYAPVSA